MMNFPPTPAGAACIDRPDVNFFPEHEQGGSALPARKVCAQCPALVACLEGALERREDVGIWGGAGEATRRGLARAWRVRHVDPGRWDRALTRHIARLDNLEAAGRLSTVPVENTNGPGATHGLRVTYNRGCRCRPCRWSTKDDVAAISVRKRGAA